MPNKIKKIKKGGKFIAKGSYGCVVSPNYKCSNNDKSVSNKISKLFADKNAYETEIKESQILKDIDPEGKYFFRIDKNCEFDIKLNKDQISEENDIENSCNLRLLAPGGGTESLYMYIADHAGKDLENPYIKSPQMFDKIIFDWLQALAILKKSKLVHRDIKPANLSMTINNELRRGMILDYGLLTSFSDEKFPPEIFDDIEKNFGIFAKILFEGSPLYMPHENYFLISYIMSRIKIDNNGQKVINPFYRPGARFDEKLTNQYFQNFDLKNLMISKNLENFNKPEYRFANHILTTPKKKYDEYVPCYFSKKYQITPQDKGNKYCNYIIDVLTKKYNNLLNNNDKNKKIKHIKTYLSNLDKIDVYSLGMSILQMRVKNKRCTDFLPFGTSRSAFYDMIDKMVEPDLKKRWNAEQLLNHKYIQMIIKSKNPFIDDKTRNAYYARLKKEKTKKLKERYTTKMPPNKKLFKKVRKHQGIVQTGGNAGRLRKGYRYSGKKLKSGLPQIIKCKSKKC